MADLFSVRAPLMIRSPYGSEKLIAELFPHPHGIVFFEIFWDQLPNDEGLYLIHGEITGEGPWKVGDYRIYLLGCQGTHPELAADFSQWQMYRESIDNDYPDDDHLHHLANDFAMRNTEPHR